MEPKYILEARALVGETEVAGTKDNPTIMKLYADAGHPGIEHDETPWCAALVGACLKRANMKNSGSLMARSYEKFGKVLGLKNPEKYCIGVMTRGKPSSWQGHVGFVMDFDKTSVTMLGGNQGNKVSLQKYPRNKFISFVRPTEMLHSEEEVMKASSTMRWMKNARLSVLATGIGGMFTWNTFEQARSIATDYAGLILLGVGFLAWFSYKLIEGRKIKEYKEGRYVPSKLA